MKPLSILLFLAAPLSASGADVTGTVTSHGVRRSTESVVYIGRIPGAVFTPPRVSMVVDQERLTFVPHVLPVLVGTTVDFKNSDDVLHNVFSPDSCAAHLSLGTWPKGERRQHVFDTPCTTVLLCNVHPEMEGFVVVVETPYFAVTDSDGRYRISGVPPGRYTLCIWNQKLTGSPIEIVVPSEGEVVQNVEISGPPR